MAAVGGPVESVEIAGRTFAVAADAEGSRKLGGFENEVPANGDGTARLVKSRVPWMLDGLQLSVDDANGDHEFLQAIADGNDFVAMVFTLASGVSYQGDGTITGEIQFNTQNSTAGVSLSGPGNLTPQ